MTHIKMYGAHLIYLKEWTLYLLAHPEVKKSNSHPYGKTYVTYKTYCWFKNHFNKAIWSRIKPKIHDPEGILPLALGRDRFSLCCVI